MNHYAWISDCYVCYHCRRQDCYRNRCAWNLSHRLYLCGFKSYLPRQESDEMRSIPPSPLPPPWTRTHKRTNPNNNLRNYRILRSLCHFSRYEWQDSPCRIYRIYFDIPDGDTLGCEEKIGNLRRITLSSRAQRGDPVTKMNLSLFFWIASPQEYFLAILRAHSSRVTGTKGLRKIQKKDMIILL